MICKDDLRALRPLSVAPLGCSSLRPRRLRPVAGHFHLEGYAGSRPAPPAGAAASLPSVPLPLSSSRARPSLHIIICHKRKKNIYNDLRALRSLSVAPPRLFVLASSSAPSCRRPFSLGGLCRLPSCASCGRGGLSALGAASSLALACSPIIYIFFPPGGEPSASSEAIVPLHTSSQRFRVLPASSQHILASRFALGAWVCASCFQLPVVTWLWLGLPAFSFQ